ncbi:MAG: hypothetical protein LIO65_05860, partial [Odoribacter sp.]|nr:hypothetical protein [Odoribacter sp.]
SFIPWSRGMPTRWTPIINNNSYGEAIRSAVYKRKGKGGNKVQWAAEIPKDDYYEVFVWIARMDNMGFGPRRGGGGRGQQTNNHTYVIKYGEEEETREIDHLEQQESGWVSLGSFYLLAGETTITLSDKVSGEYAMADAVKFTLLKNVRPSEGTPVNGQNVNREP